MCRNFLIPCFEPKTNILTGTLLAAKDHGNTYQMLTMMFSLELQNPLLETLQLHVFHAILDLDFTAYVHMSIHPGSRTIFLSPSSGISDCMHTTLSLSPPLLVSQTVFSLVDLFSSNISVCNLDNYIAQGVIKPLIAFALRNHLYAQGLAAHPPKTRHPPQQTAKAFEIRHHCFDELLYAFSVHLRRKKNPENIA